MSKHRSTQTTFPWRTTLRTLFQGFLGLCAMWFLVIEAIGVDPTSPWIATSLVFTAAVTRVMAIPAVDAWISTYLPFLAAEAGGVEE